MLKGIFLSLSAAIFCANAPFKAVPSQENSPPVVKIIEPLTKSKYAVNNQLQYRIKVSDAEDGESAYGEIAGNEVFVEVRYQPGALNASMVVIPTDDPKGLAIMKTSNCFTCHAFNGKLIAPSFHEIAQRYAPASSGTGLLAKRIREGSSGVWGSAAMPSHPELAEADAHEIVGWILENGKNTNLNYYAGLEGTVRTTVPEGVDQKGAFIISATYRDHGSKDNHQHSLDARDVIVLYSR